MAQKDNKALPKRGAAVQPNNELVAKRKAFLTAVAAGANTVLEFAALPDATPATIEETKDGIVEEIRKDFPDAPKDHVRDALDKAVFEAGANTLPGATTPTAAPAVAAPPVVVENTQVANAPAIGADADDDIDEDTVMANVPKAFKLRLDHHKLIEYKPGAQRMPRAHAEHWYAEANGVTVVE